MGPSLRSTCFELKMAFTAAMVSVVRRFVEEAAERLGVAADASVATAMTVHELLENVVKYGIEGRGAVRLDVQGEDEPGRARMVLTVSNEADPRHIDLLKQCFREMHAAPDPMSHYFSLMRKARPDGGSGIGLARIQAEADMLLGLTVAGSRISISATGMPFSPRSPSESP